MSAKNGKPCKKCGGNEWYTNGQCVPCARARVRQWRDDNPGEASKISRRWQKANPEKYTESVRRWRQSHPEKIAEYNRQWRGDNPEKAAENNRQWRKVNPEKAVAVNSRRRTRKTAAGGSFTAAEWKDLRNHYGNRCLCCGRDDVKLTADHVIPVAKGGSSNIDNIQPLCFSCNAKKHAKEIDYRPGTGLGRWIQRKIFG